MLPELLPDEPNAALGLRFTLSAVALTRLRQSI
jgi:hypothetical protein